MRIGLLIPANLYFAPYVKIYTTILDALQVNYDLIYFDKKGLNEPAAHRFSLPMDATASQWKRLVNYIRYSCFLRKTIKREAYDKLIVFGPQIGIFLYGFLKKHYRHRFILDYRDLSIEQRFKKRYEALLKISSFNVISSPGFKRCLPENFDYILSHNFDINILTQARGIDAPKSTDFRSDDWRNQGLRAKCSRYDGTCQQSLIPCGFRGKGRGKC